MIVISHLLAIDNPVLRTYIFYGSILGLKMLLTVLFIARYRFTKKVFISPEDTKFFTTFKIPWLKEESEVKYDDPDVERCRRAHLNDLENIPIFLILAFFYVLTNPSQMLAINLFRVFTAVRFLHTIVYAVIVVPQPARFLCFIVGHFITLYMGICAIIAYAD